MCTRKTCSATEVKSMVQGLSANGWIRKLAQALVNQPPGAWFLTFCLPSISDSVDTLTNTSSLTTLQARIGSVDSRKNKIYG